MIPFANRNQVTDLVQVIFLPLQFEGLGYNKTCPSTTYLDPQTRCGHSARNGMKIPRFLSLIHKTIRMHMRTDKSSMGAYGLSLEQVAWYQNCKYPCSLGTHFPEVSRIQIFSHASSPQSKKTEDSRREPCDAAVAILRVACLFTRRELGSSPHGKQ